jgi:hypothetical protein
MSKRNVPLNPQAENIRRDQTGTNSPSSLTRGEPNRGTTFEPAGGWKDLLPPEQPRYPKTTEIAGIIQAQHSNFNRPFVGSLDAVRRDDNPETPVLESSFVGVYDNSNNPAETPLRTGQPMTTRSSLKPGRIPSGSWATDGRKHPL